MSKSIENPYTELRGGQWLKGNLHTHTKQSDGRRSPEIVIDDYAKHKYDFLAISDHDVYTPADKFDGKGMIMLGGNEITADAQHILHVNATSKVTPHKNRQQVIDEINAVPGGLAVVAHPNLYANFDYTPFALMQEWKNYIGVEVYNATSERLHGSAYCTNKWDMLLAEGRKLWCFAHDDSHLPEDDMFQGWNMVYAHERSAEGILSAIRAGRFYATTGPTITDVKVSGLRIYIETADAQRIEGFCNTSRRFARADASAMEVEIPADATYVRFECYGKAARTAWTQPFFIK